MRYLIALLLAGVALAQPLSSGAIKKGTPPGGIGAACSSSPKIGYLDASGNVITCVSSVWTVTGGGGGGGVTPTAGPFASLPSCSSTVLYYIFTDSYYDSALCGSSVWTYFLNGVAMVPPDLAATFSSVNLGTATFDSSHGPAVISNPSDASFSFKMRVTPKPVTSTWHVILAFRYTTVPLGSSVNAVTGICTRKSSSSEIDGMGMFRQNDGIWGLYMTNSTTYSNTSILFDATQTLTSPIVWLRFGQGGGNQTWDWSMDQGVTWINLVTESANARFTPDQVGFFTNAAKTGIVALHWAVTL